MTFVFTARRDIPDTSLEDLQHILACVVRRMLNITVTKFVVVRFPDRIQLRPMLRGRVPTEEEVITRLGDIDGDDFAGCRFLGDGPLYAIAAKKSGNLPAPRVIHGVSVYGEIAGLYVAPAELYTRVIGVRYDVLAKNVYVVPKRDEANALVLARNFPVVLNAYDGVLVASSTLGLSFIVRALDELALGGHPYITLTRRTTQQKLTDAYCDASVHNPELRRLASECRVIDKTMVLPLTKYEDLKLVIATLDIPTHTGIRPLK